MDKKKEVKSEKAISRRDFLKGTAVGIAGVTVAGVVTGCAPKYTEPSSGQGADEVSGASEAVHTGGVNADWLGKAPVIPESEIKETVESEVVIIGGGHAGLQAAWALSKKNIKTSVIEPQSREEYHWIGEQIGHFNSRFLIDQGLGPYDEGEIINEFMKCSANRVNPALISQYVRNSGRMFDQYYAFVPKDSPYLNALNVHQAYGKPSYPIERSGYKTWSGCAQFRGEIFSEPMKGVGANSQLPFINRMMVDDCESRSVKFYNGHTGVVLEKEGGRVTSCIAQNSGGYVRFKASKAVVLTAGDFAGNADMCNALITEVAEQAALRGQDPASITGWGRKGDGHKMGIWAGGRMETSPRASMTMGGAGGPFGMTPFLVLNKKGKRFMNEDIAIGQPPVINRQPLGAICCVMDKNWLRIMRKNSVNHGNPDFAVPEFIEQAVEDMEHVVAAGKDGYGVRNTAITERMRGTVYGAESLEELADYLGYAGEDRTNFLASIERYNELCRKGHDDDFGKPADVMQAIETAPFYGYRSDNTRASVGLVTLSGLVTDDDFNVLDGEGKPIEGLYTAGNCLGGRYAVAYATPVAGNSIGMAMTHGMLLGEQLAEA